MQTTWLRRVIIGALLLGALGAATAAGAAESMEYDWYSPPLHSVVVGP